MDTNTRLTEIANPAAVAWRWSSDGVEHEICWVRGGYGLTLGTRIAGRWLNTSISNPERFLTTNTLAAARIAARRFVEA
jgi:hypothetical protein